MKFLKMLAAVNLAAGELECFRSYDYSSQSFLHSCVGQNTVRSLFPKKELRGDMPEFERVIYEGTILSMNSTGLTPDDFVVRAEDIPERRAAFDQSVANAMSLPANIAVLDQINQLCDFSNHTYNTNDGQALTYFKILPKTLANSPTRLAPYFYAHGGGGRYGKAEQDNWKMCDTAVNLNTVVFNMDYRLGPEVKAPRGAEDFLSGIVQVVARAPLYNLDIDNVVIAGESGGGWIVAAVSNILAKANMPRRLVKATFLHAAMLSDQVGAARLNGTTLPTLDPKLDQLEYWQGPSMTGIYQECHATDFDRQSAQNDDVLYPGRASDEVLANWPMTAVFSSEYDTFRRDAEVISARLQQQGRLIDSSFMPGMMHAYMSIHVTSEERRRFQAEEKLAFDYVLAN